MQEQAASSRPSSSERSSSSGHHMEVKEGMESDEEIRRVPELGLEPGGPSTSGGPERAQSSTAQASARRRGRSPADKEHKRLKRLLRNRVSAQQARERKKAYLNDLEAKVKDLEKKNSGLEERLSTLQNENQMLRQVDSSACLCRVERSVVGAAARHVPRSKACVQLSLRASIHPLKEKRSQRGEHRSGGGGQCPLLPGLPDDLAIACLIRVPRADHWKLRLVCRRWFRLLAGNYFYSLRRRLGLAEQWLYAVKCDRDGGVSWDVLDPGRGAWRALPPVPGEYADAAGFGCAVLGGCHLYLLGGRDPRKGPMRRVVFYSARSNRWHRAPDMLRRRHCFGACVMGNRLYVAGGESGGGGDLRSAEVFDPAKNRWSFVSDMAAALVPFVSAVHGGRWYVKGLGAQRQVLSQVYSPETDAWSVVLNSMVTGWRSPSACLDGRLYAADCKDGCRLRAYDEATDAWSSCIDSRQHLGSSHAFEAAAMVALHGKLCIVRNDMSVSVVDVATGNQLWETVAGKGQIKSFVTNLLSNIAGRGRAKNRILHCQVLEA